MELLKLVRRILLISIIVIFTPWLASSVYGINDGLPVDKAVQVEAAEPLKAPSATFLGKTIGSVTPGDLFYIDANYNAHDITVNLYITNANELTPYLRYLILKVGIYSENPDGQWQKVSSWNNQPLPDTFITLRNSPASFILPGNTKYKITVDTGSFYCHTARANGGIFPPEFYLTAEMM
ncbi:hypothetical protein ACFLWU_00190 [Chloroflexota bacterium]